MTLTSQVKAPIPIHSYYSFLIHYGMTVGILFLFLVGKSYIFGMTLYQGLSIKASASFVVESRLDSCDDKTNTTRCASHACNELNS